MYSYPQYGILKHNFGYFFMSLKKKKKKDNSLTAPLDFSNPVDLILKLSADDKVFKRIWGYLVNPLCFLKWNAIPYFLQKFWFYAHWGFMNET